MTFKSLIDTGIAIEPDSRHEDLIAKLRLFDWEREIDRKIADYRAEGKNPNDLFDPSKSDYLGSPQALLPHIHSSLLQLIGRSGRMPIETAAPNEALVSPPTAATAPGVSSAPESTDLKHPEPAAPRPAALEDATPDKTPDPSPETDTPPGPTSAKEGAELERSEADAAREAAAERLRNALLKRTEGAGTDAIPTIALALLTAASGPMGVTAGAFMRMVNLLRLIQKFDPMEFQVQESATIQAMNGSTNTVRGLGTALERPLPNAKAGLPGGSNRSVLERSTVDKSVGKSSNRPTQIKRDNSPANLKGETATNPISGEAQAMKAESKEFNLFEPPNVKARPFNKDYPTKPLTDANKRLLTDIEGRPLDAEFIAGRSVAGAADKALSPAQIQAAAKRLGVKVRVDDPKWLPDGATGIHYYYTNKGKLNHLIQISRDLSLADQRMTKAHEVSHAIDKIAGNISKDLPPNEIQELRRVYGALRSGSEEFSFLTQPEHFNYLPHQVNEELFAEGLRAYLTKPNYLKTVAPKFAARIRAAINANPEFKKVIQFNSLIAAGLIGAAGHDKAEDGK